MCSGLEIWRIENLRPVPVPKSSHGKFFTGDSYVILKVSDLINIFLINELSSPFFFSSLNNFEVVKNCECDYYISYLIQFDCFFPLFVPQDF